LAAKMPRLKVEHDTVSPLGIFESLKPWVAEALLGIELQKAWLQPRTGCGQIFFDKAVC
jgi:hypothetical protein